MSPKKSLRSQVAAHKAAERKAQQEKNRIHAGLAAGALKIARLEAQIDNLRRDMSLALTHLNDPLVADVDMLVARAKQKHINAALREHHAAHRNAPVKRAPVIDGPVDEYGNPAPVVDDSLYYLMARINVPDSDSALIVMSDRGTPTWRHTYYTGEDNQYGPFGGFWELNYYPLRSQLEERIFKVYQDMWRNHRALVGWREIDLYHGATSDTSDGGYCTAPSGRIEIKYADRTGGRFIGSVNKEGVIEISTYMDANLEFAHLNGKRLVDCIDELDRLILGE